MNIGELVKRTVDDREPPRTDLLNAEPPCECGVCDCSSPLIEPRRV